ncbi:MAG: hypothetical protein K2X77_29025 [Candidatus Obscuribacterales bacterium]|jgi:hypothetical protein|nr:hypothetical protein [Candidatus Obscuribacterales bacterium]
MDKSIGSQLAGTSEEREACNKIADEVITLFDKGKKDLDGDAYRDLRDKWSKNNCDNLEGFPPFGKIPKA